MLRITLLLLAIFASACKQSTKGSGTSKIPPPPSLAKTPNAKHGSLQAFYGICLQSGSNADKMTAKAENLNFQIASNEQLHSHGLGGLKKSTLVIPGGGAFISETQKILINSSSSEPFILIVENQYASKRLIKTECNIYAPKSKQLETCATLGYMLQRAPSHNARYTSQNSHFIEWNGEAEGKSMKIGCSGSTANGASKTAGTKLSAKYILAQPKRSIGAKLGKAKTEKRS